MTEKDLRRTYNPKYFSIDYILACQTLVPCRTEVNLPKFGFLVPDCQSQDLPAGLSFELPLWVARVISKPGRTHVSVQLPPGFNDKNFQREFIENKNALMNLRKIHDQYFEVGHLCTSLYHEDAADLAEMLPDILQLRMLGIGAATIPDYPSPKLSKIWDAEVDHELMDILELQIYRDADNCTKQITKWMEPLQNVKSC